MWKSLMNLYNTNTLFHSFVLGLEGTIVSTIGTYSGGMPVGKTAWVNLGIGLGTAAWGWFKRWLQQNVATSPVITKS